MFTMDKNATLCHFQILQLQQQMFHIVWVESFVSLSMDFIEILRPNISESFLDVLKGA